MIHHVLCTSMYIININKHRNVVSKSLPLPPVLRIQTSSCATLTWWRVLAILVWETYKVTQWADDDWQDSSVESCSGELIEPCKWWELLYLLCLKKVYRVSSIKSTYIQIMYTPENWHGTSIQKELRLLIFLLKRGDFSFHPILQECNNVTLLLNFSLINSRAINPPRRIRPINIHKS